MMHAQSKNFYCTKKKNIKEGEEARGQKEEEEKHHPYSQRSNVNVGSVSVRGCGGVYMCEDQMRTRDNSSAQSLLMSFKKNL